MAQDEIHVGDAGTVFTFTVKESGTSIDISAATISSMIMLAKPSGTVSSLDGVFSGTGSDGVVLFTSTAATFEEMGTHKFQIKLDDGSNTWFTDIYKFTVYSNLL